MALTICPECQKEISDKVNSCPFCGFPLHETELTQKVELVGVRIKNMSKRTQKLALSILLVFVVAIIGSLVGANIYNKKVKEKYIKEVGALSDVMLFYGTKADEISTLVSNVWRNSIYEEFDEETDKYTTVCLRGNIFDFNDFNVSIKNVYEDPDIISKIESIKVGTSAIEENMKNVQNPPKGLQNYYETITDLYDSYQKIVDYAINPTGSYKTYTDTTTEITDKFISTYRKLETMLPKTTSQKD